MGHRAQLGAGFRDVPGSSQLANFYLSTVVDPDLPENRPAARASGLVSSPTAALCLEADVTWQQPRGEEFRVQGRATKSLSPSLSPA